MHQWEMLVTEGHVRAARWRNAVPYLYVLAVVAAVLGISIAVFLPEPAPSNRIAEAQRDYAAVQRAAVEGFFQGQGEVAEVPPDGEEVLTWAESHARIASMLAALDETGSLPDDIHVLNVEAFWNDDWPPGGVQAIVKGRTVLVGYLVNMSSAASPAPPNLRRSFGLFRKDEREGWRYYCLSLPTAPPCNMSAVAPAMIPTTLRDFLPRRAFARGGDS